MATFTWTPSLGPRAARKPNIKAVSFGDGYEQRLAFGINTRPEVWSVEFRARTTSEANAIDTFLAARNSVEAFDWTTPSGVTARFKCEEWERTIEEPNVETVSATFIQVFDLA